MNSKKRPTKKRPTIKTITAMALSAILLISAMLMTGCAAKNDIANKGNTVNIAKLEAAKLIAPEYGVIDESAQSAAKGANEFAFKLSAALIDSSSNDSFVCSPYSVWMPLAALLNATDASAKDELLSALSAAGLSENDINDAASRMLYDLMNERDRELSEEYGEDFYHNPLKIANAIFVDNDVTINKKFMQLFMDYYRGNAINVDFQSSDAADAVNKWASEQTEGLIENIVDGFDPETVAAIANAIYFSDRWYMEFNEANTKDDTFYAPGGETTAAFMKREGDSLTYYEDDKVQAMPLRFLTGGGLYIILPKDGNANELLAGMTNDYFHEISSDSISATGKLLLPRFKIESDIMDLKDTLETLGVPLFDEDRALLTGGLIEDDLRVWLSGAMQKAMIEVDEKGTTAAAVTIMPAAGTSMPLPTEPFEMNCNKPFMFVLYSDTYDGGMQVLFTGVVNNP